MCGREGRRFTNCAVCAVEGDDYACGLAHGIRFARAIAENIESYLRRFAMSGLDRPAALKEGESWLQGIAFCNPSYAQELRGIADGARQSNAAIALLNARYELAF